MKRSLHRFLCTLALVAGLTAPQAFSQYCVAAIPDHSKYSPCPLADSSWDFIDTRQINVDGGDESAYDYNSSELVYQPGEIGMVGNAVSAAAGGVTVMGRQATANVARALETLSQWLPAAVEPSDTAAGTATDTPSDSSSAASNSLGVNQVASSEADSKCQYDYECPAGFCEDSYYDCAGDWDFRQSHIGTEIEALSTTSIIVSPLYASLPADGEPPTPVDSEGLTAATHGKTSPANIQPKRAISNDNRAGDNRSRSEVGSKPSQFSHGTKANLNQASRTSLPRTYGPLREEYIPYDATPYDIWWLSSLSNRPIALSSNQYPSESIGEPRPPVGPLRPSWDVCDSSSLGRSLSANSSSVRSGLPQSRQADVALVPLDCYLELLQSQSMNFRPIVISDSAAKLSRQTLIDNIAQTFATSAGAISRGTNLLVRSIDSVDLKQKSELIDIPYLSIYANPAGGFQAVPAEVDLNSISRFDSSNVFSAEDEFADFPIQRLDGEGDLESELEPASSDWQVQVIRSLATTLDRVGMAVLNASDRLDSWVSNRIATAPRGNRR